jgi:hypothetical protein
MGLAGVPLGRVAPGVIWVGAFETCPKAERAKRQKKAAARRSWRSKNRFNMVFFIREYENPDRHRYRWQ